MNSVPTNSNPKIEFHGYEVATAPSLTNILQKIWMGMRLVPVAAITSLLIIFQDYIRPHVQVLIDPRS